MNDDLGDRMKEYERAEAARRLMARLPICVRIDGKRFSKFTEGLQRPYDERLSRLMVATTRHLVEESAALAGYTQSDEISLLYYDDDPKSQIFLDRRVQKLTSILASMTTGYFNAHLAEALPEKAGQVALFDSRAWSLPTKDEAANTFLWRELDATKNSVSMAARAYYSHGELHDRKSAELQEMLFRKGVNWNDYPAFFKRGTFVLRRTIQRRFTTEELDSLPPRHAARTNPELVVTRSEVRPIDMPPFGRLKNRVGVLFDGEEPLLAEDRAPGQAQSVSPS
jgi:tRNA(His) guanylyltransferase